MDITITLTDTEVKLAEVEIANIQGWIQNFVNARIAVAQKNVIEKLIAHCNQNEIAMEVGVDAQVQQAYDLGLIIRAVDSRPVLTPEE